MGSDNIILLLTLREGINNSVFCAKMLIIVRWVVKKKNRNNYRSSAFVYPVDFL